MGRMLASAAPTIALEAVDDLTVVAF